MSERYPLLFGNALALPDAGLPELLFHVELDDPYGTIRALSLTFEMELRAVPTEAGRKMVPVPLAETWPAPAVLEVVLEITQGVDITGPICIAMDDAEIRGCVVPGGERPLVAYQVPVPAEWLMPESPFVLLVHREDLARLAERCLEAHRRTFAPIGDGGY